MTPYRILIVDDSSTVRMMLRQYLDQPDDIEIAGAAASGRQALERLEDYNPDVVLLDIEMPDMNGLETLAALRERNPKLPVLMFSRFTHRGAVETIEALFLGANDYVPKPESSEAFQNCIQQELMPRVRAFGRQYRGESAEAIGSTAQLNPDSPRNDESELLELTQFETAPSRQTERAGVVAIASSTGGPTVLADILAAIQHTLFVPCLVVQHMPIGFTTALALRLSKKTDLLVREAVDDEPLDAAQVWIAPGNQHMELLQTAKGKRIKLNQKPAENGCRPSADVLFRSVASLYRTSALGVVLTGMGQDGLSGSQSIVDAGGCVLVQDQTSSAVWGMPGQVARAGLATAALPPDELGQAIARRLRWEG